MTNEQWAALAAPCTDCGTVITVHGAIERPRCKRCIDRDWANWAVLLDEPLQPTEAEREAAALAALTEDRTRDVFGEVLEEVA